MYVTYHKIHNGIFSLRVSLVIILCVVPSPPLSPRPPVPRVSSFLPTMTRSYSGIVLDVTVDPLEAIQLDLDETTLIL